MKTKNIILLVVVAAIIIAALALNLTSDDSLVVPAPQVVPTPTPTAPVAKPPVVAPIPDNEERIVLKDVTGGDSSGEATRSFTNGLFSHKVVANMPDLENNFFYEGWLVQPAPFKLISTGKMLRTGAGKYVLSINTSTDFTSYKNVVITIEPDDGDPAPAAHILEGSFK